MLAIMIAHWFNQFAGRYHFPENYTCVDIETNGLSPEKRCICSIGHTVVRERKIVETKEVYLDWPNFPDIDQEEFQRNLQQTETAMRSRHKPFHHTWSKLANDGEPPLEVLQRYLDLFEDMEARREVLIAHNGWRFDMEFFQAHFHNWLRIPFKFDPELVYDTGICEKASQLSDHDDPLPLAGETMQQFSWRIGELRRRGVRWALDGHCEEQYGLVKQAGADPDQAHAAGHDSRMLYYLFEEHRKLANVAKHVTNATSNEPQQIMVDEDDG